VEDWYYPAASAAVVIHRTLWCKKGVLSLLLSCKLAAVVIHRMLWCKSCAIPALPCKLAAVVIHRMLWWKKVLIPAAQNSLLL
jgi:CBS-domain-containing membrane protein